MVRLWSPDAADVCLCDGAYRPQLTPAGKLVKRREPAWRMAEQTRDPGCLQRRCYALSKEYPVGYQHHSTSKGSGAGYPDCHLWTPRRPDGGGGSAFLELKRMGKNPTEVQVQVMAELQAAGHLVYLGRPCCLLVGAIDEMVAAFAGVPCHYVEGDPGGPLFPFPAASARAAVADVASLMATAKSATASQPLATTDRSGPRAPLFRPVTLPGRDLRPFGPATGYVIPHPRGEAASDAMYAVEQWLRTAGFSPIDVPYPIRVVVGDRAVHVHCRLGLARPGRDVRVWREGTPAGPFPAGLAGPLDAQIHTGGSSDAVAEALTAETIRV